MQIWHNCSESEIEAMGLGVFSRCRKSKDHPSFVDICRTVICSSLTQESVKKKKMLQLKDLPEHMRHEQVLRWVRAVAKRTVRLFVSHTSTERPNNAMYGAAAGTKASRSGTGHARPVDTTKPDQSDLDPKTMFVIYTACHVVFDQTEVDQTSVHFFFEDQEDRSGVIKAKAVKLLVVDRENDLCGFVCEVKEEKLADEIHRQWRENTYDVEKMLQSVTESFAFSVSHPHSLSQKFSAGQIKSTNKRDFGGNMLMYLTHSCCDLAGIEVKKVMYFYFSDLLNKERDDRWSEDFLSYLSSHRGELTSHLVGQVLIETPTRQERNLMAESYIKLTGRCEEMEEEDFRKQVRGQTTVSGAEEERLRWIIRGNIYDSLPYEMWRSSKFLELKRSMYDAIEAKVTETLGHKVLLTEFTTSPRYSVPTCAGSSGAGIYGVLVTDAGKKIFTACHSAGSDKYNIGGPGGFF